MRPIELPEYWIPDTGIRLGLGPALLLPLDGRERRHVARIPRGALVAYREWYGCREPNVGLKLAVEDVARGIAERESGQSMHAYPADPQIFAEDGGPSMASRMYGPAKLSWTPADNKRIPGGTKCGKD